ncbi:MAG: GNAT family N-acetyltransferase [Christensenellales bacterium]|jgi:predicted acetyltransferase
MIFHSNTAGREQEVAHLWEECFPEDSREYIDWLMASKYDPALCRALEEDGRLVALLHLLPLKLRLVGKDVDLPFVYGAGTLNAYRKRGYMRELLKESFKYQREAGHSCMALYPFQYGFYRKTGFGLLNECATLEMAAADILAESRHWQQPAGEMTPLSPEDMLSVWSKGIRRLEVGPVRNLERCRLRLEEWQCDGGSSLCCRVGGEAGGYALFAPFEGKLEIEEIFYADGETLIAMLLTLANVAQTTDCAVLRCELPKDEFPHHMFSDSRKRVFLEPHAMFRILDVPALMSGLETPAKGSFCIRVEDGLCPWNDDTFTVTCEDGKMTVVPGGRPDSRCDVATLSSLVCGSLDARSAKALGLFESENPAALIAFSRRKAFFFEHY